ncbi:hypothetical protein KC19_VG227200 [Ceratodon purpureus]|uniref:Uncharacterized protein n=1 Tax=Ceratodon purpureus TaxID=3225 RepID=A0A8T0HT29_CERPU|nr:hypothetical protein KC19_VG227200 [Ceratodon purpureus]
MAKSLKVPKLSQNNEYGHDWGKYPRSEKRSMLYALQQSLKIVYPGSIYLTIISSKVKVVRSSTLVKKTFFERRSTPPNTHCPSTLRPR